jgi:hypothetical protein
MRYDARIGRHWSLAAFLVVFLPACASKTNADTSDAGGAAASGGGSGSLPVCADYLPHGPTCRKPSDCDGGADCNPWNVWGCVFTCTADPDCGNGSVCVYYGCPHCEPTCTPTSCSTGYVCGANGHCAPQACDAGYDCGANGTCSPTAAGADDHGCSPHSCGTEGYQCPSNTRCGSTAPDAHGCSALTCAADADCDCGVCWEGTCASGPGWCGGVPL